MFLIRKLFAQSRENYVYPRSFLSVSVNYALALSPIREVTDLNYFSENMKEAVGNCFLYNSQHNIDCTRAVAISGDQYALKNEGYTEQRKHDPLFNEMIMKVCLAFQKWNIVLPAYDTYVLAERLCKNP